MARDPLYCYWGKARPPDEGCGYHLFSYHCLDVVAVAGAWLATSSRLSRIIVGTHQPEYVRAWMLFFIALHDLGKLDVRFQRKAHEVLIQLDTYPGHDCSRLPEQPFHHGIEGYRLADQEFDEWVEPDDEDELEDILDAWRPWLAAVAGHHGEIPTSVPETDPSIASIPPALRKLDRQARKRWVQTLESLFLLPVGLDLSMPPPPPSPLLAGFCAVCDWLGSNAEAEYFPYLSSTMDLDQYLSDRDTRARAILRDFGLVRDPLQVGGMAALFPHRQPRQVQCLVEALDVAPGLVLVEAPTGSGKTEAALAQASRLLAAGLADSIVFALPTQATANAMLARLEAIAPLLFPGEEGTNLVLAHGKARFHPRFRDLKRVASIGTAQGREEALVQCAQWLSQSRKRSFLGQIGVCTVDQVLVSVLPVRHGFVRAFGIGRSVLIIDEVHAYDSYMYGLLGEVLQRQRQAGGSAILLSATLPHHQRQRLLDHWESGATLETMADYPLLTQFSDGGLKPHRVSEKERPPCRDVTIELRELPGAYPDAGLVDALIQAAENGARAVVIVNVVADAQRLARELRLRTDRPVDLFHSRFRFRDRQVREGEILERYHPEKAGRGRILVATQVVEQSLDLDFDWMVTQLCPADLLFQRLGRLHRHELSRPDGFETPRCLVLLPEEADFGLHGIIYGDLRALWRTRQRLEAADGCIGFPDAYRNWIESVYAEEPWPTEPEAIQKASDDFWAEQIAARTAALNLINSYRNPFDDNDLHVRTLTRDTEQSISLIPVQAGTDGIVLLDGQRLKELDEWQQAEVLNMEAVNVPERWKSWLPVELSEELLLLPMREAAVGTWMAASDEGEVVYSVAYGLEKQTDDAALH